jgi:hypothetical protein
MPKFTRSERELLKSMVRTHSIFKLRDSDIIASIRNDSGIEISQATLTRIKSGLKKEAQKWYAEVMGIRYEFLALIKENWDSINELKRLTLDNYSKAGELENITEKRKNLELALKIEEDIADYLDALKFIGGPPSLAIRSTPSYYAKGPSNNSATGSGGNEIKADEIPF